MKKNKILLVGFLVSSSVLYAQTAPQGTPPATNTNARAAAAWYRGGNNLIGNGNNIFGTLWNSPIYTQTAGVNRMKLNGSLNYSVNNYPAQPKNGYLFLGQTTEPSSSGFNAANFGAFSLLHLNGSDNGTSVLQQGGHKPWMKTGITFTENGDMSYFGLRSILPDLTETVLSWSEIQSNLIPPG